MQCTYVRMLLYLCPHNDMESWNNRGATWNEILHPDPILSEHPNWALPQVSLILYYTLLILTRGSYLTPSDMLVRY